MGDAYERAMNAIAQSHSPRHSSLRLSPSKVILQTHNVVFTKIAAALDLDKNERLAARVFDSVGHPHRYLDRLSRGNANFPIIERHLGNPLHHHPVLGSLRMPLVAQTPAGYNLNSLNFEVPSFVEHRI